MAPTTLVGQKATTCPAGRDPNVNGYPIRICELLSALEGAKYVERTTVHTPGNVIKTKKAIKKAFQCQIDKKGFSLVEILSMCPTNWKISPIDAVKYINDRMMEIFPPGVYKDLKGGE